MNGDNDTRHLFLLIYLIYVYVDLFTSHMYPYIIYSVYTVVTSSPLLHS